MSSSTQRYPVVGSPLAFLDLNIEYFDRSEISVYIDDVIQAKGTTWNWFGTTEKRIVFSPSVAIGLEVLIKRTTDLTKLRHSYSLGAAFNAGTLDDDLNQVLHIAQEAVESNLSGDFFQDVDMHGYVIKNTATATQPEHVLTLGQYLEDASGASAAAAAALSAATAATTAASNATAAVASISFASQAEAEAGTLPSKVMSPLRTKQAIAANITPLASIIAAIYPVGALYISTLSTNPATLFGFGTWVTFGAGRTLVSLNSANSLMDTVEETFGVADTVLPTHNHGGSTGSTTLVGSFVSALDAVSGIVSVLYSFLGVGQDAQPNYVLKIDATHTHTIPSDGVSAINKNYQPSIAVYMWKRTA